MNIVFFCYNNCYSLVCTLRISIFNKMVRAWYIHNDRNDQKTNHQLISLAHLFNVSGVEYYKLNVATYEKDGSLEKIKKNRGYTTEDELICSKESPNFEKMSKMYFTEHLHADEEIRLILGGSGYFDVRDKNDKWIRIEVASGDLLILPGGIYHRFSFDTNNYIHLKRFFTTEAVWSSHNRPADNMECRKKYLDSFKNDMFVKD